MYSYKIWETLPTILTVLVPFVKTHMGFLGRNSLRRKKFSTLENQSDKDVAE